jgi:membrane associated rhomboid family serine protease
MDIGPDEFVILVTARDPRAAAELALVLEARAIAVQLEQAGRITVLRVPAFQRDAAIDELEQYRSENRGAPPLRQASLTGSGWPGVLVYVAVLVAIVPAVAAYLFDRDWLAAGRVDGAAIAAGEWWRTVTALTLHADAAHLVGNAGFGAFFGYALARSLGGGFAWLLIVCAGALGNLANAYLAGSDHRAIGASTAVFGALGILTAYSWRTGLHALASWRQRIAPVIAGIGLLAFTGTAGENTDIGAHLLGFVAGFAIGAAVAATGAPQGRAAQLGCGLAAAAIVVLAWVAALAR